ncbi:MAG TPA: hypothetical protein VK961_11300 [Chthoniobacter sp.]|nr:hypothetical protein [Chthoniobacter sp.]
MQYVFYTDFPPIQNGGNASHSIAWSWCQAMREHTDLVLTRRFHRNIDTQEIQRTLGIPIIFIPDLARFGLRRFSESFRYLSDAVLLGVWLLFHSRTVRKSGGRIFFFNSNHFSSLVNARLIQWLTRMQVDIYLVDDLEASALLNKRYWRARITRFVERRMLRHFDRIYVISQGYVEHLKAKYGVKAQWLPLVIRTAKPVTFTAPPVPGEVRFIGFSGSINELYREALLELNATVQNLNKTAAIRYKIAVCVPQASPDLEKIFPDPSIVEIFAGLPNDKLVERLAANYANFLPYSFAPALEIMVSTAFSCKTSEYFAAGRPILVYGPPYASLPRHFIENDLPLVCTDRGNLERLIRDVERFDSPALIASYSDLVESFHSPTALRRRLVYDNPGVPVAATTSPL